MIPGVRIKFPNGRIVEFTYHEGCHGTSEEWVAAHLRQPGDAIKERFESDVPVNRTIEPDGRVINE